MKLEIGITVNSSKLGLGTITKIITKSTGYVEVTYNNGKVNKEMAFNLTDENGVNLKEKKATATTGMNKMQKKQYELRNYDNTKIMSNNDYDAMIEKIARDNRPSSMR